MLLTARFNQIDTQINSVESQIATLQNQLSELQNHRQHLQSVEQACESALTQIDTALMMLNHIDASCIATFKDAVMSKFEATIPSLPECDLSTDEVEQPTQPIEPNTDITDTIDVNSEPSDISDEPITDTEEDISLKATLISVTDCIPNAEALTVMTINELKELVRKHQNDEAVKQQFGNLKRRSTWELAAKAILQNL